MKQFLISILLVCCFSYSNAQNISTIPGTADLDSLTSLPLGKLANISIDVNGNLIGYLDWASIIVKFDIKGKLLHEYNEIDGPVAADSQGNIYYFSELYVLSERTQWQLSKIDTKGETSRIWTGPNFIGDNFIINLNEVGRHIYSMAVDDSGDIFLSMDHMILKMDGQGKVKKIGGGVIYYGDDGANLKGNNGPANAAYIDEDDKLTVDNAGNIYFLDQKNYSRCIRKIDANGIISIITDGSTVGDNQANKISPYINIEGFAIDNSGNFIISDAAHNKIYKLNSTGNISLIAGSGIEGYSGDGKNALLAELNWPADIALDSQGNIFFVDLRNNVVRKISAGSGTISVANTACPIFEQMRERAKDLNNLADQFEKDDIFYYSCVVDMISRGYNSPYAGLSLSIPADSIPAYFKDDLAIKAVRSQLVEHIRTKAANRARFAQIGASGDYSQYGDTKVYAKETVSLFCDLSPDHYTAEFWDALWMTGYIDYDLYNQVENKLIVLGYKDYFEKLNTALSAALIFEGSVAIVSFQGVKFGLSRWSINTFKSLSKSELPDIIATAKEEGTSVEDVAQQLENWLGKDFRKIKKEGSDNVFMSKDGLRKLRFDIVKSHGDAPHLHLQELVNGEWVDAAAEVHRIYPKQ